MTLTNALAYYGTKLILVLKSFMAQDPGDKRLGPCVIKPLMVVVLSVRNKLDCLSMAGLYPSLMFVG